MLQIIEDNLIFAGIVGLYAIGTPLAAFLNLYLRRLAGCVSYRYERHVPFLELQVHKERRRYMIWIPRELAPEGSIIFKQRFTYSIYVDGQHKSLWPAMAFLKKTYPLTAILMTVYWLSET